MFTTICLLQLYNKTKASIFNCVSRLMQLMFSAHQVEVTANIFTLANSNWLIFVEQNSSVTNDNEFIVL